MEFTEILDLISRNTTTQNTTSSSYPIAAKTRDVNNSLNQFFIIANSAAGNWRPVEDTNQTKNPVVLADIVDGQRDYSYTTDEQGNQIMDIYKVRAKMADGTWKTLTQIDQNDANDEYLNSDIASDSPDRYYLSGNSVNLVETPGYDSTDGLEFYVNRTSTYFTVNDTTKKAGIPWVFHEYLALRPSYFYAAQKGLDNKNDLKVALYGEDGKSGMEGAIRDYYSNRNRDFSTTITPETVNSI